MNSDLGHSAASASEASTTPLSREHADAIQRMPYVRACLLEYANRPEDSTAIEAVKAIAAQVQSLAASTPALPNGWSIKDAAYVAECLDGKWGDGMQVGSTDAGARFIRAVLATPSRSSADTARPGSDEQDAPASPAPPQGERHTRTLMELLACCEAWEPDVRILGNVSAEDAADAIRASLRAAPAVPVAQDEREAPSVDAAYYMGAKGGQANEAERLAFEAWMRGHCWALCAEWTGTQYLGSSEQGGDVDPRAMMTRRLWAAWRDRAALSAATPPAAPTCWAMACSNRLEQPPEWLERAQPADNKENGK